MKRVSGFTLNTIVGQLIGGVALLGGIVAAAYGITGNLEVLIESTAINAKLLNASPGAFLMFIGMIVLWRYKPKESTTVVEERHIVRSEDIEAFIDTWEEICRDPVAREALDIAFKERVARRKSEAEKFRASQESHRTLSREMYVRSETTDRAMLSR